MGITVQDLLDSPSLGLALRAGAKGIGRPVAWAHISEMDDPGAWLEGGELVVTAGLGLPSSASAQAAYVERLAARGAAALAIGVGGRAPRFTAAMLRAADRVELPIMEIPFSLPFTAITRLVATANDGPLRRQVLAQLRIFDTLQRSVAEGYGLPELMTRLEDVSALDIYALSPQGRPLFLGFRELVSDFQISFPLAEARSPFIPNGYVVPITLSHRRVGHLVAIKRGLDAVGLVVVQYIATVVALELATIHREREVLRREGAEILSQLFRGSPATPEMSARLAELGFEASQSVRLVSVRGRSTPLDDRALDNHLCDLHVPHLMLKRGEVCLLISAEDRALQALADFSADFSAGASRPVGIDGALAVAQRESEWSLERALERRRRIVQYSSEEVPALWLPSDPQVLRQTVARLLGPVMDYDASRGTDLLKSLQTFLRLDRRLDVAASELSIHKHTLAYRLQAVERLTNRKLAHLDDLIELRLALYAKQLLADDAAATVPPLALKPHDGQLAETDVAPGTGLPGITTAEPGGRAPGR
jgi:purine catabolism regulator